MTEHKLDIVNCARLRIGRDDFGLFWNFNTGKQIPPCVTETRRYGYILGSGGCVETPRHTPLVGEKSLINVKK